MIGRHAVKGYSRYRYTRNKYPKLPHRLAYSRANLSCVSLITIRCLLALLLRQTLFSILVYLGFETNLKISERPYRGRRDICGYIRYR